MKIYVITRTCIANGKEISKCVHGEVSTLDNAKDVLKNAFKRHGVNTAFECRFQWTLGMMGMEISNLVDGKWLHAETYEIHEL